jgi:hypothetical protein
MQTMITFNESQCPLCHRDNSCAMANNKTSSHCWCQTADINPAALAQTPIELRNKQCICQQCATRTEISAELK